MGLRHDIHPQPGRGAVPSPRGRPAAVQGEYSMFTSENSRAQGQVYLYPGGSRLLHFHLLREVPTDKKKS